MTQFIAYATDNKNPSDEQTVTDWRQYQGSEHRTLLLRTDSGNTYPLLQLEWARQQAELYCWRTTGTDRVERIAIGRRPDSVLCVLADDYDTAIRALGFKTVYGERLTADDNYWRIVRR